MNPRKKILCVIFTLLAVSINSVFSLSIDDFMNAAIEHDSNIQDAMSSLKKASNSLFVSHPLYGTTFSVSSSVSGTEENIQGQELSAGITIPLAKWISFSAESQTDLKSDSGSSKNSTNLSVSISPFAKSNSQDTYTYERALIEVQQAIRESILSVRKEYRAYLTALSELEYKQASLKSAQTELSRIQYLVELGTERKSKEINALSNLMEAQEEVDAANDTLSSAIIALVSRTGLEEELFENLDITSVEAERNYVNEEQWSVYSADLMLAKKSLEQQKNKNSSSISLPNINLGAKINDSASWSVSARASISPDLFFQKDYSTAKENLAIQERALLKTEQSVKNAWIKIQRNLSVAELSYENAKRFLDSAQVSYEESELLFERGELSSTSLESAKENVLQAQFQMYKAEEGLENARDQLDVRWQLSGNL